MQSLEWAEEDSGEGSCESCGSGQPGKDIRSVVPTEHKRPNEGNRMLSEVEKQAMLPLTGVGGWQQGTNLGRCRSWRILDGRGLKSGEELVSTQKSRKKMREEREATGQEH